MLGFYNYTVIPTYMGLLSSVFGIYFAANGKPLPAVFCLMLSGALDAFDGKIAKTKKRTPAEKRFGIQIDSLSDLVCFGVLPALIGYSIGMKPIAYILVLGGFILAALIRLAYFNVAEEERQDQTTEDRQFYEGLPVTSVALLIPLVFCVHFIEPKIFTAVYAVSLVLIAIAFVSRFKISKPRLAGVCVMLGIGVMELILLIAARGVYGV